VVIDASGAGGTCSGTVIAANVVLTAGHCAVDIDTLNTYDPSDYQVMTGSLNDLSGGQESGVSDVVPYPDFERVTSSRGIVADNDLALLQLSTPTSAPTLPYATSADNYLYDAGTPTQFAGWGLTSSASDVLPDSLQTASTVVQSSIYCQQQANITFGTIYDGSAEVCAIDAPSYNEGICSGDSGGPLVASDVNGNAVEVGISSWVASNCTTTSPGFFTNVDQFSSWISTEIQLLSPPVVKTGPAGSFTETAVTLNGTVNPNGVATKYYFQYGPPGTTGHTTPAQAASNGTLPVAVSARLTGLTPGEAVEYRLIAINANGTSTGQQQSTATVRRPLPEWGTYGGSGPRVQHIRFNVKKDGKQINELKFDFTVSCTRHLARLGFSFDPAPTFPLNTHEGLGLTAHFRDSGGFHYTFTALLTTKGRASGTISVVGDDPSNGVCRSGLERWSAH
jgi:hypothetical protein